MSFSKMLTDRKAVPFSFFLGSLFDVSGNYTSAVQCMLSKRRQQRRKSVEDAFIRDISAIAGDMRKSMDAWAARHE